MNVYPTVEEASDENNCIGRPIRSRLLHIYIHTRVGIPRAATC